MICAKKFVSAFSNYYLDFRWFFQQTGKISSGSKIFWFDFLGDVGQFQGVQKTFVAKFPCLPCCCSCTSSKFLQTTSMCVENELKSWRDCVFSVASPQNINVRKIFFYHEICSEYSNILSSEYDRW